MMMRRTREGSGCGRGRNSLLQLSAAYFIVREGIILFSYPSREMARWRVTEG